jgi:cold shock CspA family protein
MLRENEVFEGHAKAGKERGESPAVTVRDEDFEPGKIKFIHRDGYGFISRTGKSDVYFHVARLDPETVTQLYEGVEIKVAVGESKRGPAALAIELE